MFFTNKLLNLFIALILFKVQISVKAISCEYSDNYNQVVGNTNGYTCNLNLNDSSGFIYGYHKGTNNDDSVKFLKKSFKYELSKPQSENFKTFPGILCTNFKNLKAVYLSDVGLESFDSNSLQNCQNLLILNLGVNKIQKVDSNLFKWNKKLEILLINKNKLIEPHEDLFSSQSSLKILDLSMNEITKLPNNIFKHFSNLRKLKLQHNKIYSINSEWFKHLPKLEDLDLSSNLISDLPGISFQPSKNLIKLSLNNNKIRHLRSNFFKNFGYLEKLLLNNNNIYRIFPNAFTSLTNLKYLWLKRNKLRIINSESFGGNLVLKYVSFDNNDISAIDKKFIYNTKVSEVSILNNECSKKEKEESIEKGLELCFEEYDLIDQEYRASAPSQASQPELEYFHSFISDKCGRKIIGLPNIVLGQNIVRGEYPWVVALVDRNGSFFCGGTLISNKTVITAAHCIKLKNNEFEFHARDIRILAGVYDLKNSIEVGRLSLAVKDIHIHHNWHPDLATFDGDVAILELEQPVVFNQFVQPVCRIDPESSIGLMKTGIVVGYGKDEDGSYGEKPKMFESPIYSRNECFTKNSELEPLLSPRMFCGGYANGTGTCVGDSGSGLYVVHDNTFYLRGIVSASLRDRINECNVYSHSVFTDTLAFHLWIEYTISKIHSLSDEEVRYFNRKLSTLKIAY